MYTITGVGTEIEVRETMIDQLLEQLERLERQYALVLAIRSSVSVNIARQITEVREKLHKLGVDV